MVYRTLPAAAQTFAVELPDSLRETGRRTGDWHLADFRDNVINRSPGSQDIQTTRQSPAMFVRTG